MKRVNLWIALAAFCLIGNLATATATVVVDTKPGSLGNAARRSTIIASLKRQLLHGAWDKYDIRLRVKGGGSWKESHLKIDSKSFARLSPKAREAVARKLASYYDSNALVSYEVSVDTERNRLDEEPIIHDLGIDTKTLSGKVAAEHLLSPYAQKWAYKASQIQGPNCWHTSMASIFPGWEIPRRIPPLEFSCHVKTSFVQIDAPSQWGDLIRLSSQGEEVHGFTFLGVDRQDPKRWIVFTKNGMMPSHYLFMDFETVANYVYPGNEVTFHRAVSAAVDPAAHPGAPCDLPKAATTRVENEPDPIVRAGMRLRNPRDLPPLDLP